MLRLTLLKTAAFAVNCKLYPPFQVYSSAAGSDTVDKCIDIIGKRKEASVSDKSVPSTKVKKQAVDCMMTVIYNLVLLGQDMPLSPSPD